ncbi:hypothetical protein EVAR_81429_1 [Eumeta japonica]|uniref:Uncharacterized protein n=1 Tax=Eumeta variegata TaxID=151549 RepID=A0A4C1VYJ6_EUMVA|nr:hypothetical protein EVAR_81429_1 [Eumeta japonica]
MSTVGLPCKTVAVFLECEVAARIRIDVCVTRPPPPPAARARALLSQLEQRERFTEQRDERKDGKFGQFTTDPHFIRSDKEKVVIAALGHLWLQGDTPVRYRAASWVGIGYLMEEEIPIPIQLSIPPVRQSSYLPIRSFSPPPMESFSHATPSNQRPSRHLFLHPSGRVDIPHSAMHPFTLEI